jgi:hypothetical protein
MEIEKKMKLRMNIKEKENKNRIEKCKFKGRRNTNRKDTKSEK